jgi:hypothetical protein
MESIVSGSCTSKKIVLSVPGLQFLLVDGMMGQDSISRQNEERTVCILLKISELFLRKLALRFAHD